MDYSKILTTAFGCKVTKSNVLKSRSFYETSDGRILYVKTTRTQSNRNSFIELGTNQSLGYSTDVYAYLKSLKETDLFVLIAFDSKNNLKVYTSPITESIKKSSNNSRLLLHANNGDVTTLNSIINVGDDSVQNGGEHVFFIMKEIYAEENKFSHKRGAPSFIVVSEKEHIYIMNGVKVKVEFPKYYTKYDTIKPCLYRLSFIDKKYYIGSSMDGGLTRFKNHINHLINSKKEALIQKRLKEAIRYGEMVTLTVLDTYNDFEIRRVESSTIRQEARKVFNKLTKSNSDWESYKEVKDVVNKILLNEASI